MVGMVALAWERLQVLLDAYRKTFKGSKGVLQVLEKVRQRGRKRSMVG